MKLLLTSAGLTNASISDALFELVGKKPEDTSLVFVPTASNKEAGDKIWLIDDLINLKKQNFKSIDIADISAVDRDIWLPKFEQVDVLYFEGGDEYYLMKWMRLSGLDTLLPELLKTRVYVGVSAGSMVTGKDLASEIYAVVYEEELKKEIIKGLGFVEFYIMPHLNSDYFTKVREENIMEAVKEIKDKVYALDDQSALKVLDGNMEVVSEGQYLVFN
ncbi:MAG: Type 1 glutamine amidotransferase-like domain-containing protein [Candidatus Zambryskibacteria bacterium]|nr:Type 1 glutamine amidotransferase-like domain-containing protein [Candidatus Zambryskibacteria bacterium]